MSDIWRSVNSISTSLTNRTDECAKKCVFDYSSLLFISVTDLLPSFQGLRLICLSPTGFNNFLPSYMFISVVVLLQDLKFLLLEKKVIKAYFLSIMC